MMILWKKVSGNSSFLLGVLRKRFTMKHSKKMIIFKHIKEVI